MRLRAWTAFFAEGSLVFWNVSFAKDGRGFGAIYLGPEERRYLGVLQRFVAGFDPRARPTSARVSDPSRVRSYALVVWIPAQLPAEDASGPPEIARPRVARG